MTQPPSVRDSTPPVYVQVADAILSDIASGRLADGARLKPERVLARDYDVSVGTLRRALARLEDNSLLRRIQGSGNYVAASGIRDSIYAMFRLERVGGGGLPTALLLDLDYGPKPRDVPDFGIHDQATRFRRLRSLDAQPVALEEIFLDGSAGTLTRAQIGAALYATYREKLGLWVRLVEDHVSPGTVPDWRIEGATIGLPAGAVCGFVERWTWGQVERPVEYSRTWYNPDRARYVQRMT